MQKCPFYKRRKPFLNWYSDIDAINNYIYFLFKQYFYNFQA